MAAIKHVIATDGQVLTNINIMAAGSDPIAQPLSAYPSWLKEEVQRPLKVDLIPFHRDPKLEHSKLPKRVLRALNTERIRRDNSRRGA